MTATGVLATIFFLFTTVIIIKGVRIVRQSEAMVIERLGKYRTTLNAGINIIIPLVDRPREIAMRVIAERPNGAKVTQYKLKERVDQRETVFDFPKQGVITKDNVVTEINALIYFQIIDPVKAVYEINNLPNAIEKLTQTTLRNVIGELELDECLTSRDTINMKLRAILDEATNKWGVKVNRVELQDINPPTDIKRGHGEANASRTDAKSTKLLTQRALKKRPFLRPKDEREPTLTRQKVIAKLKSSKLKEKPMHVCRLLKLKLKRSEKSRMQFPIQRPIRPST